MRTLNVMSCLMVGLAGFSGTGCGSNSSVRLETAPPEIQGVWMSDDARYEGRNLEIHVDAVVFHVGDGGFTTHTIREVRVSESETGKAIEMEYQDEAGGLMTFYFTYRPGEDVIVFENQPEMHWSRVATPSPSNP